MYELIFHRRKIRLYVHSEMFFIILAIYFACAAAQDASENTQCVNDLVQWCGDMKKSTNFVGNYITNHYSSSGERRTVHCMAGSGGINCTLNNYPWFACRPDGRVIYKNNELQENYPASDDGVCDASATANNMFTYNSAEMEAALNAGREAHEKAMANLHNTMNNMKNKFAEPCFPFCNSNPFGRGFPFNR